jgi:hypothetical protein
LLARGNVFGRFRGISLYVKVYSFPLATVKTWK